MLEGGRGKKEKAPETGGFSRQRLGDARTILAHSPDIARAVASGGKGCVSQHPCRLPHQAWGTRERGNLSLTRRQFARAWLTTRRANSNGVGGKAGLGTILAACPRYKRDGATPARKLYLSPAANLTK